MMTTRKKRNTSRRKYDLMPRGVNETNTQTNLSVYSHNI